MPINAAALASAQETEKQLALIEVESPERTAAMESAKQTTSLTILIRDPVRNVQYYGAKGDGRTDDTDAFNRASAAGPVIVDQPGDYLLDPVKRVTLLHDLYVLPDPGVIFRAKANGAPRYRIFNTNASSREFDVGGAKFIGDRAVHVWREDSTHEWGYCFFLGGSKNHLFSSSGIAIITGATGDGLGITGQGHEVNGLTLEGNRRQGCSAFNAGLLKYHHNVMRNTGFGGKPDPAPRTLIGPFCGFDAEPDRGDALGLELWGNTFGPDNRSGLILWINRNALAITPNMKLSAKLWDNTIQGNSNGTWFCRELAGQMAITAELLRNRFVNNKNTDAKCDQGSVITIGNDTQADSNTFDDLSPQTAQYKKGFVKTRYEMQALRGAQVNAGWNYYT